MQGQLRYAAMSPAAGPHSGRCASGRRRSRRADTVSSCTGVAPRVAWRAGGGSGCGCDGCATESWASRCLGSGRCPSVDGDGIEGRDLLLIIPDHASDRTLRLSTIEGHHIIERVSREGHRVARRPSARQGQSRRDSSGSAVSHTTVEDQLRPQRRMDRAGSQPAIRPGRRSPDRHGPHQRRRVAHGGEPRHEARPPLALRLVAVAEVEVAQRACDAVGAR
jgi:hypothetical protein